MTPEDAQKNIYINIAVTREMLETLLKRGKPASVADLQTLMASVEAKSRSTYILPAKEVADALAPKLLPLLPTPDNLVQAGQQSAVQMAAAIKAGTAASVELIQVTMQKFVTTLEDTSDKISKSAAESAAVYQKATAAAPRSLPVSFTDNWRWPAGLVVGAVAVVLLWQAVTGLFSKVSAADYEQLQAKQEQLKVEQKHLKEVNANIIKQGRYYMDEITRYKAKNKAREAKANDFPFYKGPK